MEYAKRLRSCLTDADPLAPLRGRKLSPNTKHQIKAALSAWAKYTDDGELRKRLEDFQLPPARRVAVREPLTKDQFKSFLAAMESDEVSPPIRACLRLMALRGFRVGDLLRMTRKEAQRAVQTGTVTFVAKKGTTMQYALGTAFKSCFESLLARDGWTTVAESVAPRSKKDVQASARRAVANAFKHVGQVAGLDPSVLHPHKLRRTYATFYLEAVGNNLEKLRAHMGWANVATAAKYVDHTQQKELDAVADTLIRDLTGE